MTSDSMMDLAKILQDENRKLTAELAAAKAEVERLKVELNHEKEAKKFRSNLDHETFMTLRADLDRHKRALELALYYVEGDATYEGVKEKVSRILEGGE